MGNASGTGIGHMHGRYEAAEVERIESEYAARLKAGFPCGTHTLYRKTPRDTK